MIEFHNKLDVDSQRDEDESPMSSYRCMLRPTWMFMDKMIAPINVHITYKLKIVYKTWQQKHSDKLFFFNKMIFLTSHVVVLVKAFPLMYQLLM